MAINLHKNKDSMLHAWKEVVDDKNNINWALFGYDGQTFDLKLISKGDGGLAEMTEDLNSGKIMYAFCRVIDPKTSLPKFVMINWQGEGAQSDKKGKCANHLQDLKNFLKGAHVTINARTDDDVDPDIIMEQVSKATGSAYSFKERAGPLHDHKPIGSVYRRTIPAAEINPAERDMFWEKEEAEERRRIEDERHKAEDSRRRLEEERKQREISDTKRRDEAIKERTRSISELRAAEKNSEGGEDEKRRWKKQVEEDAKDEAERRKRSDTSRQQRAEEVQALISKRTINAWAIFEQNTSAGQMSTISGKHRPHIESNGTNGDSAEISSSSVNSPPSTGSLSSYPFSPGDRTPPSPAPECAPNSYSAPNGNADSTTFSNASSHANYARNLLKENLPPRQEDSNEEDADDDHVWEAPVQDDTVTSSVQNEFVKNASPPAVGNSAVQSDDGQAHAQLAYVDDHLQDNLQADDYFEGQGLAARALYDYQAADGTEISFNPDDIITNIDQIDEGWWQGLAPDGTYGLFPANYVELLE